MGVVAGVQRYLCHACGRSFRNTRKPSRRRSALWRDFLQNRAIVSQLAKDYGRSVHWIRKELRAYELPKPVIVPDKIVAIMDCVFFRRSSGYLVVRMLTVAAMCIGAKLRVRQSMSTSVHEIRLRGRVSLLWP